MQITETISLKTNGECDVVNITHHVEALVSKSNLKNGTVTVFVTGSTAGVTTIEYEPGLVSDIKEAFERIAPKSIPYAHNETWGDGNGLFTYQGVPAGGIAGCPVHRLQNGARHVAANRAYRLRQPPSQKGCAGAGDGGKINCHCGRNMPIARSPSTLSF